jgi:serine/threonine protein kinase
MTRNWNELEAVSLDGRYWLKVCLTSSADDAWYLTRFDTDRDAAVRVMAGDSPTAERQLEMWKRAIDLEHPHLTRMFDAGRTEVDGQPLIYAVCEYPDDVLATALTERPLSPSEARQVLEAVRQALGYLHGKHLVHTAVDTAHILAFGDEVKLPSDTIQPAGAEHTTSDDMRALGVLIHQMLTRDVPREDAETDYSFLPRPFGAIVNHTLTPDPAKRWTTRELENHLNPPPPKPVVVEKPMEERPAPASIDKLVERPARAEERVAVDAERTNPPVVTLPPPHRRTDAPVDRGLPLKWVPVAGLAAAAALGAVLLRHPDQGNAPEKATKPAVTAPAPAAKTTPKTTPTPPPAAPAARPSIPDERKPSPVSPQSRDRLESADARPSTGAPIWRVVAYTYNRRQQAESKAKSLNERRSAWKAEVFSPKGDRAPYFVSLGGRMTLAEAERVQKDARSKGLPRDTFVRNFSR